jgi:Rab guanine nucleotide exchange factor SEC2
VPVLPTTVPAKSSAKDKDSSKDAGANPPVPPKRRGLWSMASAFGERAASWGEGDKEKEKAKEKGEVREKGKTPLLPPPVHPAIKKGTQASPPPLPRRNEGRRIPPPLFDPAPDAVVKPPPSPPSPPPRRINGERDAVQGANNQPTSETSTTATEVAPSAPSGAESEPELLTTPTEEISNPKLTADHPTESAVPPQSPSATPLPESRPQTPTTPLPNAAGNIVQAEGAVPAASPAARPPLPRRAAARGPRPMSSIFSSKGVRAPAVLSVDSTTASAGVPVASVGALVPETPAGSPPSQSEKPVVVEPADKTAEVSAGAPPSQPEKPAEVKSELVPESGVQESASDPESQGENPETAVRTSIDENNGEKPTPSATVESALVQSPTTPTATPNGISGEQTKSVPSDQAARGATDEPDADKEAKTREETGEVYIGDVTWEERTWKEVVRLREDMFWARVGGLR